MKSPPQASTTRARVELMEATAELRELAQGIHPTILTDQGLVPAVERLAGPQQMGALFKMLAITQPNIAPPPFAPAASE